MPAMCWRSMFKQLKSLFKPQPTLPPPRLISSSFPLVTSLLSVYNKPTASWLPIPQTSHTTSTPLKALRILTWNVDFAAPNPPLRMHVLLTHLESFLGEETPPIIILFQEVHPEALEFLLEHTWVRRGFAVTNTILPRHSLTYGTVTLIAKDLVPSVGRCFRVPFKESEYGRDVVFVDLKTANPQAGRVQNQNEPVREKILRVGNTHLESLPGPGTATRPLQLKTIKEFLSLPGVYAGIVGGDMNAIAVEDEDLPVRMGLRDLWVGGGGETWGYQPSCVFPPGRLDKVLVLGDVDLARGTRVELVGVGLKTGPEEGYVSDHYGLMSTVQVGLET